MRTEPEVKTTKPEPSTIYEVQFTFSGFDRQRDREVIRTRGVIIGANYSTFEDLRKIIVTGLSGRPADFDKIHVLTVTKIRTITEE